MKFQFLICVCIMFVSCNEGNLVKNKATGQALGTTYSIIYFSNQEQSFETEIDSVFKAVNQSLSTYIPNSDISKINNGDSSVEVDHMFKEVFNLSKEIYKATDGYFDPTVGVLVNAWGFGPERKIEMDSVKIDSLLKYVGFDKVSLSQVGTIKKTHPNIYFDFNAIAKGYAIDRLAVMLDNQGIANYLIEVGGELVAKGQNKIKEKPWVVGIDDPEITEGRELKQVINLSDRALASSGNYRKFRIDERTGMKFVHTIDPKTGYTKNSNTLGVTVVANNCATADAYATAFMAMDLEKAFDVISKNRTLEAYIIYMDEQGQTQEFLTSGFEELVVK
ncbi:FAD:protein FMN transferase [Maribacter aestuarii]|uniref:FAD:protein FMN transferase n=1 Tax=Maribacter aestuarii TaxID=1130723 RepID=UPI0025A55F97|nr:FAD:protein FMN transferase [Maribacter aestuarii]